MMSRQCSWFHDIDNNTAFLERGSLSHGGRLVVGIISPALATLIINWSNRNDWKSAQKVMKKVAIPLMHAVIF
jgi:hypothetical protein